MTITEVCIFPMIAGVDITDKSSQAYKTLKLGLDIVARQPGFEQLWYGSVRERPDEVQLYIDWDKLDSHTAFTVNEPDYKQLGDLLSTVLAGPASFVHIPYIPTASVRKTFSAPCTEHAKFYFATHNAKFDDNVRKFIASAAGEAHGWTDAVAGWAEEEVEHDKLQGKGRVYGLSIGWDAYESHMSFKESDAYSRLTAALMEGISIEAVDIVHVEMKQV